MNLADMKPGQKAEITGFLEGISIEQRLKDLGFTSGTKVVCVGRSPLGDPVAYKVCGAVIAIRKEDARWVMVKEVETCAR